MKDEIRTLADHDVAELKRNIGGRMADMEQDDRSHALTYEVLGISRDEGKLIGDWKNKNSTKCRRTFVSSCNST